MPISKLIQNYKIIQGSSQSCTYDHENSKKKDDLIYKNLNYADKFLTKSKCKINNCVCLLKKKPSHYLSLSVSCMLLMLAFSLVENFL